MAAADLALIGMAAAVLAVISQIYIPTPGGVPATIQILGVVLVGTVLGWKRGVIATLVYILLGAAGLPVFSGFHGGMGVLTGMAGGYVLAWPILAFLAGISLPMLKDKPRASLALSLILTLAGVMIDEAAGALQWSLLSGSQSFFMIMIYSFTAFIPKDIILAVIAVLAGRRIRRTLKSMGHLS